MQSNQIKQRHVTTNDNFYHWIYRYLNLNVQQRFVETYIYALAIQRRIAIKLARPISHHMQKAVKRTIIFIKY